MNIVLPSKEIARGVSKYNIGSITRNLLVVVSVSIHFRFVVMSPQMSYTSSLHVFMSSFTFNTKTNTNTEQYNTLQYNAILTNTKQYNAKQYKCLECSACFHVLLHVPKQTVSWHHNRAHSSIFNWLLSVHYFLISFVVYSLHSMCFLNWFWSARFSLCCVSFVHLFFT